MIIYKRGNLLEDPAEALVNAVNTVGVMGAGIARQFKLKFPDMFIEYERACKNNEVQLGKMHVVEIDRNGEKLFIINFPTLEHWSHKSTLSDIELGLEDLVSVVQKIEIRSIAIPPLGCGIGGLEWADVKRLIESTFTDVPNVTVHLYEPL